ncbi:GntR family transcriptional regulator [Agromyces larvae]|uniref:GntR family transcriptional regulator n=1 Tax=Agromyces larvae TaxID=2929802 RepID=A0ABY4BWM2_9MICO|nr:GntR family transcriptional regulator [Agromyces larvae]UOE43625.1 GntR family transcriptional regulator [Agromyces larvae]
MITVDPSSSVPVSEQVRAGIAADVRAGELAPGERLPTVRALAADLGLAVNTVGKAYRELERDGVVQTLGRRGTFVAGDASDDAVEAQAQAAASAYAERIARLGLEASDAIALVRRALRPRD